MVLGLERQAPLRQQTRQLARFFVIARPFDRALPLGQLGLILLVGVALAARAQGAQRAFGPFAAVDARRSEEHDRILDLLFLETAERLEILRENSDRTRFRTFEKLPVQIRERLMGHES